MVCPSCTGAVPSHSDSSGTGSSSPWPRTASRAPPCTIVHMERTAITLLRHTSASVLCAAQMCTVLLRHSVTYCGVNSPSQCSRFCEHILVIAVTFTGAGINALPKNGIQCPTLPWILCLSTWRLWHILYRVYVIAEFSVHWFACHTLQWLPCHTEYALVSVSHYALGSSLCSVSVFIYILGSMTHCGSFSLLGSTLVP